MSAFKLILLLFSLFFFSCKNEEKDKKYDIYSCDVVWKDIDSLTQYSKKYKIYYIDSTWIKKRGSAVDTNFIKEKLWQIDWNLYELTAHRKILNEQGFKYEFFFLDTLKNEPYETFVLLLGKYLYTIDPSILNQCNLFLVTFSGNRIIACYQLAHNIENLVEEHSIKTSIILNDFKIITRVVDRWCSDMVMDDITNCSEIKFTSFYAYNQDKKQYFPFKRAEKRVIEYERK